MSPKEKTDTEIRRGEHTGSDMKYRMILKNISGMGRNEGGCWRAAPPMPPSSALLNLLRMQENIYFYNLYIH